LRFFSRQTVKKLEGFKKGIGEYIKEKIPFEIIHSWLNKA
jgi:hypothetical protein